MKPTRSLFRPSHRRIFAQLLLCLAVLTALVQPASMVSAYPEGPESPEEWSQCGISEFNTSMVVYECEFLDELYHNTDGNNWIDQTNWFTSTDPCSWYGVVCTDPDPEADDRRHIKQLNLGSNNLTGSLIPDENYPSRLMLFEDLVYADTIDLSSNNFEVGGIPASIGLLADNLEVLNLSDCRLTGTIPWELGGLSALRILKLDSNPELKGEIPASLGDLTNLTELSLFSNNFEHNPIPPELGYLSNLEYLDLNTSDLDGTIPAELGLLTNLKELRLHANWLGGPLPPELADLAALEILNLSDNYFEGAITPITSLPLLRELSLGNNLFDDQDGTLDLTDLASLETLYLDGNFYTEFPLGTLPVLRAMVLSRNNLVGLFPPDLLDRLPMIDYLDINYNGVNTSDPTLAARLNELDDDGNWRSTQTIPPDGIVAVYTSQTPGGASANLFWAPIDYQDPSDASYYEVEYSTSESGTYTPVVGSPSPIHLADNTTSISGLAAGDEHWVRVRAHTAEFPEQKNAITSMWSDPVKLSDNPVPELVSVSPSSVLQDQAAELVLTGSNFVPGMSILWNGAALDNPVFVDTQSVRVTLGAAQTHINGSQQISVRNPAPCETVECVSTSLPVLVYNPGATQPTLSYVSPSLIEQNQASVINLVGTNFQSDSSILWNGDPLNNPQFIDAQHMRVEISDQLTRHVGLVQVSVSNPGANEPVISNIKNIEIYSPDKVIPVLTSVSPGQIEQFTAPELNLVGTGFSSGDSVLWNGEPLAGTQFIDSEHLSVQVPSQLTQTLGVAQIAVRNPGLSGSSNVIEVKILEKIFRSFLPITVLN